jgi:hypothetical protein
MTRTPAQKPTSGTGNRYPSRYDDGTNETAPGGATNTVIPGPCRLIQRSRLVTHHRTLSRPPNITQMGGS